MNNIGIFTGTYLPKLGGVQIYLSWLMRAIDDNFFAYQKEYHFDKIYFFIPECESADEALKFKYIIPIKYKDQSVGRNLLRQGLWLGAFAKKHQIRMIHCHDAFKDALVCLIAKSFKGVNYMITSHGHDIAYDKKFAYGMRLSYVKDLLIRGTVHFSSALTTISTEMCKYAQKIISKDKLYLIPNIYEPNTEGFQGEVLAARVKFLMEKFEISMNDTIYLCLSGNRKIKGHENMLKAFAKLTQAKPQAKLLIGAHGHETESIKQLVKHLGIETQVCFIGFVVGIDKEAFFKMSHAYVNAAFIEPFGLTYLESMKHHLPVIASKYGGAFDIFTHKKSAYLVDPYSIDEICDGMDYFTDKNHRERIALKASALLERYHYKKILPQFFELYQKVGCFDNI